MVVGIQMVRRAVIRSKWSLFCCYLFSLLARLCCSFTCLAYLALSLYHQFGTIWQLKLTSHYWENVSQAIINLRACQTITRLCAFACAYRALMLFYTTVLTKWRSSYNSDTSMYSRHPFHGHCLLLYMIHEPKWNSVNTGPTLFH